MRRPLSALVAVLAAAAVVAPADAAMSGPAHVSGANQIELIGGRDPDGWNNGRRHNWNNWDSDGWNGGDRHRRYHQRYHRENFFPQQFFFGLPFAFAPQHRYRQDCIRGGDGRIYCSR